MPSGRPAKPIEQKRRTGNPGKRPLPSGNLAVVPALERGSFDLTAAEAVERVLDAGYWLAESDAPTAVLLRDAVEDYERLRSAGAQARDVREARVEVARLAAQLGFDPTARSKLGLAEVKAASKLEQLRRAREG